MIKILNDTWSEGSFVLYDPTTESFNRGHQVIKIKHKNYYIMQFASGKIWLYHGEGWYKAITIGDS